MINTTPRDMATVLAALRFYQAAGMGNPENRSEEIHQIATNDGMENSLDGVGIDALCEKLNAEEWSIKATTDADGQLAVMIDHLDGSKVDDTGEDLCRSDTQWVMRFSTEIIDEKLLAESEAFE